MIEAVSRLGGSPARRLSRPGALARFGFDARRWGVRLTAACRRRAPRLTRTPSRCTGIDAVGLAVLRSRMLALLVIAPAARGLGRYDTTDATHPASPTP